MKKVIYLLRLVLLVCLFVISYNNSYSQTPARTKAINTIVDSLPDNNTKLITPSRLRYTLFRMLDATKDSVPILDMINLQKNIPNGLAGLDGAGKILTSQLPSETDPTVASWIKSITSTEKSNWNTAFAWGNHASAGYLVPIISSPTEGQVLKYISGAWRNSSPSNSPDSTTASNGLGLFEKDVQLGGTLTRNTGIEGPYQLEFAPKTVLIHPIDTLNMYVNANPSAFILITTNGIDLGTDTRIDGGLSVFGRVDLNNSNSPLGLPTRSSDPVGTNGDIYYNTSNNTFRIYENSTWKGLPTLSDAAADGVTKGIATYNSNDFNSSGGVISLDYNNMQIGNGVQSGILTPSIYTILNQGASNGLSKSGNDIVGGGPLTGGMVITGTTNAHKVYIRGNDESGVGADGVFNTTVRGVNFFDSPTAIYAADSSDGGGWGLVGYSTNGVGISGTGLEAGVTGGTTNTGPGVKGMLFGVNNTNYAPISSEVWGHSSGTGTSIFPALDLIRTNNGSPITGAGTSIRWKLPYQNGAFIFSPIQTNTIESVLSNNLGANFTSDLRFTGVKDSIYGTYMVIKGGGQIQLNNYGDGLITGTPTQLLGVDVNGNVVEAPVTTGTPTLQQVITAGSTLTSANAISAGTLPQNFQSFITTATFYGYLFSAQAGNGGALEATAVGTTPAFMARTISGPGAEITTNRSGGTTTETSLNLRRRASLGASNNIGHSIDMYTGTSTGGTADVLGTKIISRLTTATTSSEVSQFEVWGVNGGSGTLAKKFSVSGPGQLTLDDYGINTFAGTAAYLLGVDASGNVVETAVSGGATPTWDQVMTAGDDLTSTYTTTFSGSNKWILNGAVGSVQGVLEINNTSGNGAGVKIVSTGYGVEANGPSGGVRGTSGSAPGVAAELFDDPNLNSPLMSTNTGRTVDATNVIGGLDLIRSSVGGTPGNGTGMNIRWMLPNNDGSGGSYRTSIDAVVINATPASYDSELRFRTTGSGTLATGVVLKGTRQLQLNAYGVNTFAGTPAYALGVDASGNVVEFSAAGGGSDGNGIYTGNGSLSGATTITGAGNTLTLTGTQASNSAFNIQNTGNGSALSVTASGSGATSIASNTGTGIGMQVSSVGGVGLSVSTDNTNAASFTINPASTNTTDRVANYIRRTTGTAANNMGLSIGYQLEDDAGSSYSAAQLKVVQTTAAAATRTTAITFSTVNSGTSNDRLTITGPGQIRGQAYGVGTFTGTTATFPAFDASGNIIEYTKQSFFQTATGTVTNTSAETTVISTGVSAGGGLTIPVAKATVGRTYRIKFAGIMTTGPSGSSTFTFRVKLGSVVLGTTGSIFIGTNITRAFEGTVIATIRGNGASGTISCMGFLQDANSGNTKIDNGTTPTATVDFTSPQTWDITTQMGTASTEVSTNVWIVAVEEVNFNN